MENPESGIKIKKLYVPALAQGGVSNGDPGCTDVIVLSENRRKYVASFFSYAELEKKHQQNKRNGAFMGGLYFWEKNMVIVEECSSSTIEKVVRHMIDEGEFQEAFKLL